MTPSPLCQFALVPLVHALPVLSHHVLTPYGDARVLQPPVFQVRLSGRSGGPPGHWPTPRTSISPSLLWQPTAEKRLVMSVSAGQLASMSVDVSPSFSVCVFPLFKTKAHSIFVAYHS